MAWQTRLRSTPGARGVCSIWSEAVNSWPCSSIRRLPKRSIAARLRAGSCGGWGSRIADSTTSAIASSISACWPLGTASDMVKPAGGSPPNIQ